MKTYLLSYDLRIPETSEDYERLIDYIKSFPDWATPLKSVWFIKTNKTVADVRDEIKKKADSNDGLIVIDITEANWATSGISKEITDWMTTNL